VHIHAFWCIFDIFIAFHPNAFVTFCMVLHIIAFIRIHVWCILILMHLLTFIRIFNAAFGTRCIHVHLNASYFGCIFLACCILVHSLHKMHSCAFFVCCILYMPHLNAFQYIFSLVHFECAAFYLWATRTAPSRRNPSTSWRRRWAARPTTPRSCRSWAGSFCSCRHENACKCIHMHTNAYECKRMQTDTYECRRMHTRVSIHEWMHLRTLVNACVSECIWMRLNA